MISSQQIITGFLHTLKLLQNDHSSNVHTKVLQMKRNHPIITGSYEYKLLTFFFISEPLHNDLNTNVSTRVLHIKCYATKKKIHVWLTNKTSIAPRKSFKLKLMRTNMSQIWKLNRLCHHFCEIKFWIYIEVTLIVSQSPLNVFPQHQHQYWFTYKPNCHMCTCNHLAWLLTFALLYLKKSSRSKQSFSSFLGKLYWQESIRSFTCELLFE